MNPIGGEDNIPFHGKLRHSSERSFWVRKLCYSCASCCYVVDVLLLSTVDMHENSMHDHSAEFGNKKRRLSLSPSTEFRYQTNAKQASGRRNSHSNDAKTLETLNAARCTVLVGNPTWIPALSRNELVNAQASGDVKMWKPSKENLVGRYDFGWLFTVRVVSWRPVRGSCNETPYLR